MRSRPTSHSAPQSPGLVAWPTCIRALSTPSVRHSSLAEATVFGHVVPESLSSSQGDTGSSTDEHTIEPSRTSHEQLPLLIATHMLEGIDMSDSSSDEDLSYNSYQDFVPFEGRPSKRQKVLPKESMGYIFGHAQQTDCGKTRATRHSSSDQVPHIGNDRKSWPEVRYGSNTQLHSSQVDGASGHCKSSQGLALASRKSSITGEVSQPPDHEIRIHFAPSDDLEHLALSTADKATSSRFLDPFSGDILAMSRQASDISDISRYLRPNAFAGHKDTLARFQIRLRSTATTFGSSIDLATSSVSEIDDCSDTDMGDVSILGSHRLPIEVLHDIFLLLHPCDFDAARHTCRLWFLASLDRRVSHTILRRAGYHPAFLADLEQYRNMLQVRQVQGVDRVLQLSAQVCEDDLFDLEQSYDEEWLISKRLATEARLSASWHGSGLREHEEYKISPLSLARIVFFDQLASQGGDLRTFSVSTCGRFVLVAVNTRIFIYQIDGAPTLKPIIQLEAHRQVLALSMDACPQRYAVAALLEERTGVCWEIDVNSNTTDDGKDQKGEHEKTSEKSYLGEKDSATRTVVRQDSVDDVPSSHSISSDSTSSYANSSFLLCPLDPIATYEDLGSVTDSPRSVAVYAEERCVAFGCGTGVELHWVEMATGFSRHRWFPIAAPSDCLHFLPRQPESDSQQQLKLISSAKGPLPRAGPRHNSFPATAEPQTTSSRHARRQNMTSLFFGQMPFVASTPLISSQSEPEYDRDELHDLFQTVNSDHYCAIPLSDGVHMLFIDPGTGVLCLGSDAPLGGPTRLIRKVCMSPNQDDEGSSRSLVCYTAGRDLRWGVRVVAAYDDGSVYLYNIPSECFAMIRHIKSDPNIWGEFASNLSQSDLLMDIFMLSQVAVHDDEATWSEGSSSKSLHIDGAFLCKVQMDVEDLAVNSSNGALKVWIFEEGGLAMQLDVYVARDYSVRTQHVGSDGLLYDQLWDDPRRSHVTFAGYDGCNDYKTCSVCGPVDCGYSSVKDKLGSGESLSPLDLPVISTDAESLTIEILTDWKDTTLMMPYRQVLQ